jgi:predicted nucleotidyltransferase
MAASAVVTDPVLIRFRRTLDEVYGPRLERVVPYGSRARGDARSESDYDVAVFLRDMDDRYPQLRRLADLSTDFITEMGESVHAMPYRAGAYNERTPLMLGVRNEGVDL